MTGVEYATLSAFFKHEFIEVVPLDRATGELAAQFGEQYGLKPADAIHLATAVRTRASVLMAWDGSFFRHDAMRGAPILIERPASTESRQLSHDVDDAPIPPMP